MSTYGNDLTEFHDIAKWVALFARAEPDEKAPVALQWLERILRDIAAENLEARFILYQIFEPYHRDIREMVSALPRVELYKRVRRDLCGDNSAIEGPADKWLISYLNYSTINGNTPQTENVGLVRNLWLSPSLEDRKYALLRLADGPGAMGAAISPAGDVLLRNAAWDVARELDMAPDVVIAATKVTIESYRTDRPNKADPANSDPLSMAILRVLSVATIGNRYSILMPLTTAQELIVEHPAAAITLLHTIENSISYRTRAVLNEATSDNERLTSLTAWLPSEATYIAMARDVMESSYKNVLNHILANETRSVALDLPELPNIEPGAT